MRGNGSLSRCPLCIITTKTLCPTQELRQSSSSSSDTGLPPMEDDVSDLGLFQQQNDEDSGGGGGGGAKAYSGQEMKQRYYEAFWRAR